MLNQLNLKDMAATSKTREEEVYFAFVKYQLADHAYGYMQVFYIHKQY